MSKLLYSFLATMLNCLIVFNPATFVILFLLVPDSLFDYFTF